METLEPPPRCVCGKQIYPTRAEAVQDAMRLRVENGLYRDEYRCLRDAAGGWHLRNLTKRYEKIRHFNGEEARELLEKIKRLDLLIPEDADRPKSRKARRNTLEDALRKLPPGGTKALGRRGQLSRARRYRAKDDAPRARGTRGTAVTNELRRRVERARLREELLREEKENGS